MAEITDFPERRDQISIAADEIGKELKKMQGFKTVGPENKRLIEIFGGRNIPRKFTFAHMQELLKDMSPIAGDENTIFSLSQIIEEKFPGTIDKKDFAAFEERFGSVLDTQDKGGMVNLPANDPGKPAADVSYKSKIASGTITVREAIDAVLDKKLTDSMRKDITSLINGLAEEGIDMDAPYFQVYDTKEFAHALEFSTSKSGVHRYKEFNSFETQFNGLVKNSGRNEPYKRLGDFQGTKGIANEQYGLFAKQLRAADPMRGTIESKELDKLYNDALISPVATEVDTKRGIDKPVILDQETVDYLLYEKYTGQRAESNIGTRGGVDYGLKIADFNIIGEGDDIVVEARARTVGNKTRPEATYRGEFAAFLADKIRRAKEAAGPDADYEKINLFQTTPGKVTAMWDSRIRPLLEKRFRSVLPIKKVGSHSVLRKILARQLLVEFKFPHDAVKSWMGHAGAGVDASGDILIESYVGAVADDRIGEMTNVLIRNDALNNNAGTVNSLFVSRGTGYSPTVTYPTPTEKVTARTIDVTAPVSTAQPMSPGVANELDALADSRATELRIGTEGRKSYLAQIRAESQTAAKDTSPKPMALADTLSETTRKDLESRGLLSFFEDVSEAAGDVVEDVKEVASDVGKKVASKATDVGKVVKSVPYVGPVVGGGLAVLAAQESRADVERRLQDIDVPKDVKEIARDLATASEFTPLSYSYMRDVAGAYRDMIKLGDAERETMLSRARKLAKEKGFIDEDEAARVREEAASAAAEPTGFLSP